VARHEHHADRSHDAGVLQSRHTSSGHGPNSSSLSANLCSGETRLRHGCCTSSLQQGFPLATGSTGPADRAYFARTALVHPFTQLTSVLLSSVSGKAPMLDQLSGQTSWQSLQTNKLALLAAFCTYLQFCAAPCNIHAIAGTIRAWHGHQVTSRSCQDCVAPVFLLFMWLAGTSGALLCF
jgi:hypothetical protein